MLDLSLRVLLAAACVPFVAAPDAACAQPLAGAQARLHWLRNHGGPGQGSDEGTHVALDAAGRVFAAGVSYSPATSYDFSLLCYDRGGEQLWQARYDGPAHSMDRPGDIEPDGGAGAGGLFVSGLASGLDGLFVVLARFDAAGEADWIRRIPVTARPGAAFAPRLARDGAGNLLVCGHDGGDFLTLKFDAAGTLLWSRRHAVVAGAENIADDIAVDAAGSVYVAGHTFGRGFGTISYDAEGTLRWAHLEPGPIESVLGPAMVLIGPDGNPVVAATPESTCGVHHIGVWKLAAADGAPLWTRFSPESRCDSIQASALAMGPDGSIVVTGTGRLNGGGEFDYQTVKYSAEGDLLWLRSLAGPGGSSDRSLGAAIDGAGNVYITGTGSSGPSTYDFLTVSYGPAGERRWIARLDTGTTNERANAIAVGPDGAVHLVGTHHVPGAGNDMAVFRYVQLFTRPAVAQPR